MGHPPVRSPARLYGNGLRHTCNRPGRTHREYVLIAKGGLPWDCLTSCSARSQRSSREIGTNREAMKSSIKSEKRFDKITATQSSTMTTEPVSISPCTTLTRRCRKGHGEMRSSATPYTMSTAGIYRKMIKAQSDNRDRGCRTKTFLSSIFGSRRTHSP